MLMIAFLEYEQKKNDDRCTRAYQEFQKLDGGAGENCAWDRYIRVAREINAYGVVDMLDALYAISQS
jgi:hypothetical protein